MNTSIEHPQPRQPRSHFNDPPSRPLNGPAYTFGNGDGDEPPHVRPGVADLTAAMSMLVPALSRFLEEQQVITLEGARLAQQGGKF